jgi:hypothetical protein
MGFACAFVTAVIVVWVTPKFLIYARRLGTVKTSVALGGGLVYGLIFAFALIPALIFIELLQNPKTTISDAGITYDATLTHRSTRIRWNEINRVSCLISRSGVVTGLTIRATDSRKISIGNSGTTGLRPIYDLLKSRLGDGIVQRCWVPFPQ